MEKNNYIKVSERNYNIDLLKIMACVAVVGLHSFQKDLSVFNSSLYYLCGFAVPIFFMSSGAFLLNRGAVRWKYIIYKVAGILRIVALWNVVFIIIRILADVFLDIDYNFTIYSILAEIIKSLLQKGSLWHFWYFGALLILYVFLPLLSRLNNKQKRVLLFVAGIISIGIYLCSVACAEPLQKNVIQTFRLWTWIFYFMAGGFLINYGGGRAERKNSRKILLIILSACILIYQNLIGRYVIRESAGVLHAEFFYDDILTMLWVFSLFTYINSIELSTTIKEKVSKIAPLTMGIYIIHPLVIKIFLCYISVESIFASLVYFIMVLTASTVIVAFLSRIPFIRSLIVL